MQDLYRTIRKRFQIIKIDGLYIKRRKNRFGRRVPCVTARRNVGWVGSIDESETDIDGSIFPVTGASTSGLAEGTSTSTSAAALPSGNVPSALGPTLSNRNVISGSVVGNTSSSSTKASSLGATASETRIEGSVSFSKAVTSETGT